MRPCFSFYSVFVYIQILPVSALAVLPDFHRVDGFSELISVLQSLKSFSSLPAPAPVLSILIFFSFSFLSSYFSDVLFCKVLIEFFFRPDILSIQEVSASPIVQLDCEGKSSILYDNGCPKKHTQILPLAPQGGANVGRVASENIQTLEGKEGANYALFGGGRH